MADEPTALEAPEASVETTDAEVDTPAPEEPPKPTPKPAETVDFWKTKAREQEKRAKDNAAAAMELAALKDADKTELQREREAREAAQKEAADLRADRQVDEWKAQVSKTSSIPAAVLRGTTLEEIEDHAAELKALLPEPRKAGQVPAEGRTVTTGTGDPAQQFAELIRNARK